MRRHIIAGNWKMFKTIPETRQFFSSFMPMIAGVTHCEIVIAPPFTALPTASEAARGSNVAISAQDVYWENEGAFTGEISVPMLHDAGCIYAIIGHSERRQLFGETNQTVNRKVRAAIAGGLQPIVCVGETLAERDAGKASQVVQQQLREGLAQLTESDLSPMIVAYELVWAIGTGRTATPETAAECMA
jgi:triosephosphate isomerase